MFVTIALLATASTVLTMGAIGGTVWSVALGMVGAFILTKNALTH